MALAPVPSIVFLQSSAILWRPKLTPTKEACRIQQEHETRTVWARPIEQGHTLQFGGPRRYGWKMEELTIVSPMPSVTMPAYAGRVAVLDGSGVSQTGRAHPRRSEKWLQGMKTECEAVM